MQRFFLAGNSQQAHRTCNNGNQGHGYSVRKSNHKLEQVSNNIFQARIRCRYSCRGVYCGPRARWLRCLEVSKTKGDTLKVERGLQFVQPLGSGQEQHQYPERGLEETICSMKLRKQIDDASSADLYNPINAAWVTHLTNFIFPVLKLLQLSAKRGVLYNQHGIVSPHWMMNAHQVIYVTNGNMRMQIVNDLGQQVFNEQKSGKDSL